MLFTLDGNGPIYRQLYRALRKAILEGELRPGARLPATRSIAHELGLSRNVVLLAFDQLRAEGYLEGRVGAGTFVASPLPDTLLRAKAPRQQTAPAKPVVSRLSAYGKRALALTNNMQPAFARRPRYDFRFGEATLDRSSMSDWRRLLNRHADRLFPDNLDVEGYPLLRQTIADYVYRARGISCDPEQVIVVNGTQQALDLIARVFLDVNDTVVIEEPHYAGAREVFVAAGARLVPCPVDSDGLDIDAADIRQARLAYVTPSHQFPTGAVMPLPRRLALLAWAQRCGAFVIEDDYDSEYRYEGRPVEAVQALDRFERTIYIGTFSKILFSALRLGFVIVPQHLLAPFRAAKYLADRHSAVLSQAVLADFIAEGHFERHLRRMRATNQTRRAALLSALDKYLGAETTVTGTNAGVHLTVWLPSLQPGDLDRVIDQARVLDVGLYSLNPLFYHAPSRAGLLLGYSNIETRDIDEGLKRLARVLTGIIHRKRD